MKHDVFIAYKGTDDKNGTLNEAKEIYKFLKSKGKDCYLFCFDPSPVFGDTWKHAKESKNFLFVLNNSIKFDLDENSTLKKGTQLHDELKKGFLSNYDSDEEAFGKVRTVCCGGLNFAIADGLYPSVTHNVAVFEYNKNQFYKILNWLNGFPDEYLGDDDDIAKKRTKLEKLYKANSSLQSFVEKNEESPFLVVCSLPEKVCSDSNIITLSHIKQCILGTVYPNSSGNNFNDYMDEISDGSLSNIVNIFLKLFSNKDFPKYFEKLYLLKYTILETYCVKIYGQYIQNHLNDTINDVQVVNRKSVIPFGEKKQIVSGLFGYIDEKDSLIRDDDQFSELLSKKENISEFFQNAFNGTVLYIDFNDESQFFKSIHRFIGYREKSYPRRAYLINSSDNATGFSNDRPLINDKKNYEKLCFTAEDLFEALYLSSILRKPSENNQKKPLELPNNPYMYLESFKEENRDFFFGRDLVVKDILQHIMRADQITVLSAESGFGKTSIINAGVVPCLKESEQYDVFTVRSFGTPWLGISRVVFDAKDRLTLEDLSKIDIKTISRKSRQLIVIDQFEEFFVYGEEDVELVNNMVSNLMFFFPSIKILISIRKDFISNLLTMPFIKDRTLNMIVQLQPLYRDDAIKAIVGPAEKIGWRYADGLAERIVDDLNSLNGDDSKHYIDPTQLQIVCDKLFTLQSRKSNDQKTIVFDTYYELGEASGILYNLFCKPSFTSSCSDLPNILDCHIFLGSSSNSFIK